MIKESWNNTEKTIYKAVESGKFEKVGTTKACDEIAKKLKTRGDSIRSVYARMLKYGAFPKPQPAYVQVSFRMSPNMHEDLRLLAFAKRKSINSLLVQGTNYVLRRG